MALSPWEGVAFLVREWRHAMPLVIATVLTLLMLMLTWIWGRRRLAERMAAQELPVADFVRELGSSRARARISRGRKATG